MDAARLFGLTKAAAEPTEPAAPWWRSPLAGAAGAAALATPAVYALMRRRQPGANAGMRAIQQASKGQFTRVVEGHKPNFFKHMFNRFLRAGGGNVVYTKDPNLQRKLTGVVHHAGRAGTDLIKGDVNLAANAATRRLHRELRNDKWREYKFWEKYAPGSMGRSESLADVFARLGYDPRKLPKTREGRAAALQALQDDLRASYGKGFLLKDTRSAETIGKFPTEKSDFNALRDAYRGSDAFRQRRDLRRRGVGTKDLEYMKARKKWRHDENYAGRVFDMLLRDPTKVMVQEKLPIKQLTGARAMASKALGLPLSQEVRVHVQNGVVVPDMTFHRYDPAARVLGHEHATGANAYAQELLDRLPKRYRRGSFAMDLAPLKDGRWGMIESNPSGKSGFFTFSNNPLMGPKSHVAYTGRHHPLLAGAVAGAAGAGAGAAGYYGLRENDEPR